MGTLPVAVTLGYRSSDSLRYVVVFLCITLPNKVISLCALFLTLTLTITNIVRQFMDMVFSNLLCAQYTDKSFDNRNVKQSGSHFFILHHKYPYTTQVIVCTIVDIMLQKPSFPTIFINILYTQSDSCLVFTYKGCINM